MTTHAPIRRRWIWPALALATALVGVDRYSRMSWPFQGRLDSILPPVPALPRAALSGHPAALVAAADAAESMPRDAASSAELGRRLHALGFLEAAEQAYRRAALIEPDRFEYGYLLARSIFEEGRLNDAAAVLDAARRHYDGYLPAAILAADLALQRGRPQEAAIAARRALALRTDCAPAIWRLGLATKRQGDVAAARQHFLRALQLQPDFGEARYALAMIDRGMAETAAAQRELDRLAGHRGGRDVEDPLMDAVRALGVNDAPPSDSQAIEPRGK